MSPLPFGVTLPHPALMRFAVVLCLIASPILAQGKGEIVSDRIVSFETGVICAPEAVGTRPAPDTVAGTTHVIDVEPPFVSTENRVPAVLGIGFGIKAMASGYDGIDDVTMRITHPPMGDGGVTSQTYPSRISGLDPSLTFYQFDFDYELLEGTWQMEAFKQGTLLYRTSFEVVAPRKLPELASVCGYEDLLS